MKVSAVLITKEKEYPQEVLDTVLGFDEILIVTECPNILKRYETAIKARNEVIYVQDDDCIVDSLALQHHYNGQITDATTEHHINFYDKKHMALVGFGCYFPKKMINFDRYINKWGVDKLLLSQADRVFTYLNQPFNHVIMPIKTLPRSTDNSRMSMQPDHWNNLVKINEKLCVL